uniref:RB binding protein 6, ubiquitin ligase n=1 Tax=Gallus gallus TaxID=9031 RepID=A0A8V0Z3R4_CHICK
MSCVHYKFSSKLNYDTVTFDGLHISLCDLKRQIMAREKLKAADCDLQITNAQTKEEYTDDNALIPKNSSVIVRRIPIGGVKATSKTYVISRTEPVSGTSKAIDDSSASISLAQLTKFPVWEDGRGVPYQPQHNVAVLLIFKTQRRSTSEAVYRFSYVSLIFRWKLTQFLQKNLIGCKLWTFQRALQQPKKNKCFCYMDNCMAIFEFVVFLDTDPFLNVAQFYKL